MQASRFVYKIKCLEGFNLDLRQVLEEFWRISGEMPSNCEGLLRADMSMGHLNVVGFAQCTEQFYVPNLAKSGREE